jgi:hypothetical protein
MIALTTPETKAKNRADVKHGKITHGYLKTGLMYALPWTRQASTEKEKAPV